MRSAALRLQSQRKVGGQIREKSENQCQPDAREKRANAQLSNHKEIAAA
jgi:hypothetical protein